MATAAMIGGTALSMGQSFQSARVEGKQFEYAEKMKEKQRTLQYTADTSQRLSEFNESMGAFAAQGGVDGGGGMGGSRQNLRDKAHMDLKLDQSRADTARFIEHRRSRNAVKTAKAMALKKAISGLMPGMGSIGSALQTTKSGPAQNVGKGLSLLSKVGGSRRGGGTRGTGRGSGGGSVTSGLSGKTGMKANAYLAWAQVGMNTMNNWINSKGGSNGW